MASNSDVSASSHPGEGDESQKFYGYLNSFMETWGRRIKLGLGTLVVGAGAASLYNRILRAKPKIRATSKHSAVEITAN